MLQGLGIQGLPLTAALTQQMGLQALLVTNFPLVEGTLDNGYRAHTVNIACIDARFNGQVKALLKKEPAGTLPDVIKLAGGAYTLVDPSTPPDVFNWLMNQQIFKAAQIHRASIIRLLMHEKCAVIHSQNTFENRDAELRFLIENLMNAGRIVRDYISQNCLSYGVETMLRLREGILRVGTHEEMASLTLPG